MIKRAKGCAFGLLIGTLLRTMFVVIEFLARIVAKILVLFGLWIPLIYAIFGVILYYFFHFNPFDFSLYSTLYLSGAAASVVGSLIISIRNIVLKPAHSVMEGFKHPLWEKNREENIEKEEAEFAEFVVKKKGEKLSPEEPDDFEMRKYRKKEVEYLPPAKDFGQSEPTDGRFWGRKHKKDKEELNVLASDKLAYNTSYNDVNPPFPYYGKNDFSPIIKSEKPKVYFSKLEPDLLVHEYSDRFELFRIENNRSVFDRVEYK